MTLGFPVTNRRGKTNQNTNLVMTGYEARAGATPKTPVEVTLKPGLVESKLSN